MSLKNNEGVCVVVKVREIIGNYSKWIPSQNYNTAKPEVSVLLPTFRRAKSGLFEAAVQSVLNQDFKNLELIIIDDASTDGTADLISHFMQNDPRVSCIRHERNVGLPAISEYEGYMKARGAYIAFIFDDNEWEETALSETIPLMKKQKIKASYGCARLYYMEKGERKYIELGHAPMDNISRLYCDNFIANGAVVLHRDVVEDVGLYDPHLALTRLCDWDLWRRISDKYEFLETGIYFTNEDGYLLSDSLGNSYKMDIWAAEERMQYYRDELLRPCQYADVEICDTFGKRSEFFLECLKTYLSQYENKPWYDAKKFDFLNDKESLCDQSIKRVVVLTMDCTASVTLYFNRILRDAKHTIKLCCTQTFLERDLALAEAIVIERNLIAAKKIIDLADKIGVPCYYFVDDNFIELSEDYPDNPDFKLLASETTAENLEKFKGILLSTNSLVEYFAEQQLHDNLILLEPSIDEKNICMRPFKEQKKYTIAFIGGAFRNKVLVDCVLPALCQLSKKIPIRFCYPKDDNIDLSKFASDELEIISIPRNLSLNATLNRYKKYNIDIQIHCGEHIKNNIYKTKNALLNAVQLGAVLVTSACMPFTKYNGDENAYITCENTKDAWSHTLEKLLSSAEMRKNLYKEAYAYCINRCSGTVVSKKFDHELLNCVSTDFYNLNQKYDKLYLHLYKISVNCAVTHDNAHLNYVSRAIESEYLCPSRAINGEVTYRMICDSKNMANIGLIFTSMGKVTGTVEVQIFRQGCLLRKAALNMAAIVYNHWTYFEFDPIYGCGGCPLDIKLICHYEKDSAPLLVYEDMRNRTFLYKVLNKLGLSRKHGYNILYADGRG